jgi:hypothetical protein
MATDELKVVISAVDHFTATANKITGSLDKIGRAGGRLHSVLSVSLGVGLERVAERGLGVIVGAVRGGIDSLDQLESASTSVDAAIKQMGMTGKLTASQIEGWAQSIESSVGAAFDDKAILAASTTLLRFGHITADNLRPALVVMTDLATKTGSVESAATLLAKALADPEKAAGRLSRAGITLTKAQQDQIKALVKTGDVAKAQALILDALAKSTSGAALASQGPGKRAAALLQDAIEDAQRALAEGLLPLITSVREKLNTMLRDPNTLRRIREFGEGLAKGFQAVLDFAGKIPWGTIGDAMGIAGKAAKAIFDAFTGLPAWVQTAIITGWGLNKLTGGSLTGGLMGLLRGGGSLIGGKAGAVAGAIGGIGATPVYVVNMPGGGFGGLGGPLGTVAGGAGIAGTLLTAAGVAAIVATVGVILGGEGFFDKPGSSRPIVSGGARSHWGGPAPAWTTPTGAIVAPGSRANSGHILVTPGSRANSGNDSTTIRTPMDPVRTSIDRLRDSIESRDRNPAPVKIELGDTNVYLTVRDVKGKIITSGRWGSHGGSNTRWVDTGHGL